MIQRKGRRFGKPRSYAKSRHAYFETIEAGSEVLISQMKSSSKL